MIPTEYGPLGPIKQWSGRIGDRLFTVECETKERPHDSVMISTGFLPNQDELGDWVVLRELQELPKSIYVTRPCFIEKTKKTKGTHLIFIQARAAQASQDVQAAVQPLPAAIIGDVNAQVADAHAKNADYTAKSISLANAGRAALTEQVTIQAYSAGKEKVSGTYSERNKAD
jgi:hypothetical protein